MKYQYLSAETNIAEPEKTNRHGVPVGLDHY